MKNQCVPTPDNAWQNGGFGSWVYPAAANQPAQSSLPSPAAQAVEASPKLTPLVYTIEEAAVVLNCSTKTIRRLIARKYLTSCTVLRKKLIPRKQIETFLKATCEVPKSQF
jgi:excisionase family DNA binding protein